jgi:N-acetylmuramoyl-L-alanine amidase
MAYKLVYNWLPSSKYSLKSPFTMTPKYITIHNTWNDAPAKNEISFMLGNTSLTGFHVAIDDVEAIQAIPFNRMAYHAGDGNGQGNRASVGIEICYSKSGGDRYRKAEANAIEYTAKLLVQLNLTPDKVKYHQEWSGKNCPHRILEEGRAVEFKKAISKRYAELIAPPVAPKPVAPTSTKLWKVYNAQGQQIGAFSVEANAKSLQSEYSGSTIKYFENGKEVISKPVQTTATNLYRVFDSKDNQVGAYSDAGNALDHAERINGILRHYRNGKLYATRSFVEVKDIRVVTATVLNVRAGSGAGHPIVGAIKKGDEVEVKKDMGNGWVEIVKPKGYVNKTYLK